VVRPSIRFRLTAWHGTVLACILSLTFLSIYALMNQARIRRLDDALDFEFEETAERLAAGHPGSELAREPAAFHQTYLIRVEGLRGEIVAQSGRLAGVDLPFPEMARRQGILIHRTAAPGSLGPHRIVAGIAQSGGTAFRIQIADAIDEHGSELEDLKIILFTMLPAGLLTAVLGGYWLAGRALAPVQQMVVAARRISALNLAERIRVENPHDELGQLATTLNVMLDGLGRAFAAMSRFTADAAHELKTPVASIRAEAEVLLQAPRRADEYEEALRSIVEEVERLGRLTDRLLMLSREDAGAQPGPFRRLRLDDEVRAAVQQSEDAAARAGLRLSIGELPAVEVEGDAELLRQVFGNLLDNAVKYTPRGGHIAVRGRFDDGQAVVEVNDDGIGIPAEALPRVFDRFFRVDPSRSRRTGGTGLGLSIAKAVIERHRGTIDVRSELNEGTTFLVTLPTVTALVSALSP
jgi:heavy metal sensor kinase